MVELRKRPAREPAPAPPAKRSSSKTSTSKVKQAVNKAKAVVTGKPADDTSAAAPEAKDSDHGAGEMPVATETGVVPETTGTAGEGANAAPATATSPTAADAAAPAEGGAAAAAATTSGMKLDKASVGSKIALAGFGGTVSTHEGRQVSVQELLQEVETSPGGKGQGLVLFTYPKASTPGCTTQACLFRDKYKPITDAGYAVYGLSTDSEKANGNFVAKQGLPYPLLVGGSFSLFLGLILLFPLRCVMG